MKFYSSISKYYDYIFPLNPKQVSFCESYIKAPSDILDIGCATGNLSIALAKKGHAVKAIDLDEEMIHLAKNKAKQAGVSLLTKFEKINMNDIQEVYPPKYFDGICLFGNTLVHLLYENEIDSFFSSVFSLLKDKGLFLIQILNYDYILGNNITLLPIIENKKIHFTREHDFQRDGLIDFNTKLKILNRDMEISNSIPLFPIKKDLLIEKLNVAGFTSIETFSGFDKTMPNKHSLPFVVAAQK